MLTFMGGHLRLFFFLFLLKLQYKWLSAFLYRGATHKDSVLTLAWPALHSPDCYELSDDVNACKSQSPTPYDVNVALKQHHVTFLR